MNDLDCRLPGVMEDSAEDGEHLQSVTAVTVSSTRQWDIPSIDGGFYWSIAGEKHLEMRDVPRHA